MNRKVRLAVLTASQLLLLIVCPIGDAAEVLPVLARVGPWPVASHPIAFRDRLWLVNSVKGGNHNSADLYSYDPATGGLRYERQLFSQDAGRPVVAGGLLYWPFEDARASLGVGHFAVTDGAHWQLGTIPTARIFHTHAMAATAGGTLIAATSAWRAGLQASEDHGATWREVYNHPTPEGRVTRIVRLVSLGSQVFGQVIGNDQARLLRLDGAGIDEVPGWPRDRRLLGLTGFHDHVYGVVAEAEGAALWRTDGSRSERLAAAPAASVRDLLASGDGLWALTAEDAGGALWYSEDGIAWQRRQRLEGGRPYDLAALRGAVYVAGAGDDGQGILWGPQAPPAGDRPASPVTLPPRPKVDARRDWIAAGRELDRLLADPASYRGHGRPLRDLVLELALAGPPEDFFAARLLQRLPDDELSLIGGNVHVPAATLGRWTLLWGMTLAGRGRVPPALIDEPWRAAPNRAEKYFDAPPAAMWAARWLGQDDAATVEALLARLERADDPLWLRGDAVGTLSALTGQRFGYDVAAWRAWWRQASPGSD